MQNTGVPYILRNWDKENFNAYVLCPHMAPGWYDTRQWGCATGKKNLTELLDYIIANYNIDEDNIILGGTSMGGGSAPWIVHNMPGYFSKLVVFSGNDYGVPLNEIEIPTKGYIGDRDAEICKTFMMGKFKDAFGEENVIEIQDCSHDQLPGKVFNQDNNGNGKSDLIEEMFDGYMVAGRGNGGGNFRDLYDENGEFKDIVAPSTGLDTITGVIIEPTVEFFTFLIDALMSVFAKIMGQTELKDVMVNNISDMEELGEPGTSITIFDMTPFETATGKLKIQYPNFKYSAENIFSGEIDFLNVNFIKKSNDDENWLSIRNVVAQWYQILRMVSIIGLLSVLIYTGIKIIISSNTKDKAKYKEMIINWFIAVVLAFSMHYIMAFILNVIEAITSLFGKISGVVEVNAGGTTFKTNLIGLARFQMQQNLFSVKVGHLVIYTALVVYTFKFTFLYLKRVLKMAFLTLISPIVALTYPIDKMEGQAKGFQKWLNDFLFNALLQPLHYILYYILVSTSLTLAANNPIYGIVVLGFMSNAEQLLKKIFQFEKADQGSVGGIAGAFATGAITSSLISNIRDPLHLSGGKAGGGSSGGGQPFEYSDDDMPNDFIDDINFDDFLETGVGRNTALVPGLGTGTGEGTPNENAGLNIEKFISDFRRLAGYSSSDALENNFNDGDPRSIEEMLHQLSQFQMLLNNPNLTEAQRGDIEYQRDALMSMIENRAVASENPFTTIGMPLQYIDHDTRDIKSVADDMMKYTMLANDTSVPKKTRQQYATQAEHSKNILNRRISENKYIESQGIIQSYAEQQKEEKEREQREEKERKEREQYSFKRGMKHVGKTIAKPIWDADKSASYNGKRLAKGILKGAVAVTAGAAVGATVAAVQAGISVTDGKYNPAEGVAAVGSGMAVVASALNKGNGELVRTYKEAANSGESGKSMQEYGEQWYNRDDVIDYYNREFPGKGKAMRERVVNNYLTRGISDVKEQKQALKFAEKLKKEKGINEKEADKIAIATLQYKKNLAGTSNYKILYDAKKRKEYLDFQADAYTGSASKSSVKQLHEDFIQNVLDFDKANR